MNIFIGLTPSFMHAFNSVVKAAEALVKLAEQKTLTKFNRLVDDISCVVVDLCPLAGELYTIKHYQCAAPSSD